MSEGKKGLHNRKLALTSWELDGIIIANWELGEITANWVGL